MRGLAALRRAFLSGLLLAHAGAALAQLTYPDKPSRENFYSDEAGLLDEPSAARVNEVAWALWKEERVPLYVVTIPSLAHHGAMGQTIEGYAYQLFNTWGIGSERRNYGMLLLVSKGDRKARIELGAGWGHRYNLQANRVMMDLILPRFKQGDYPGGIVAGVQGMDSLARGLELPKPEQPWWALPAMIGFVLLVIGIAYSLFKSGRTGWGWAFLLGVGMLLWFLLRNAGSSRGGFGGGSSGGGGATGSW